MFMILVPINSWGLRWIRIRSMIMSRRGYGTFLAKRPYLLASRIQLR
jgi:hypothetical protein